MTRPDLLARLEALYTPPRGGAAGVCLPKPSSQNLGPAWRQAAANAPAAFTAGARTPLYGEPCALDTWYRVEDLWLRLGALLPPALESDREHRCLQWLGLRRRLEPGIGPLRCHAATLDTYRWHEAEQRRSLVKLLAWEQDDLLVNLMPTRQLLRWAEGEALAALLHSHLACHARPLQRTEGAATAGRSAPVPTG